MTDYWEKIIKAVEYLNWYFTQDDGAADKNAVKAWEVLLHEKEPPIGAFYIKEPDCRICCQNSCRHYHETRKPEECGSYVRYEPIMKKGVQL